MPVIFVHHFPADEWTLRIYKNIFFKKFWSFLCKLINEN